MRNDGERHSAQSVRTEISVYIRTNFLPGKKDGHFRDDDLLFESGLVDSLGAMSLIAFLGKRYDIRIRDEELFPENFASVERISSFVLGKLRQ